MSTMTCTFYGVTLAKTTVKSIKRKSFAMILMKGKVQATFELTDAKTILSTVISKYTLMLSFIPFFHLKKKNVLCVFLKRK